MSLLHAVSSAVYAESGHQRHEKNSAYFKGEAIRHLRLQISEPESQKLTYSVIYAVTLLLWVQVRRSFDKNGRRG